MKSGVARLIKWTLVILMLASFGCSTAVSEYESRPESKAIETLVFIASFMPKKPENEGVRYFSSFILEIENKSDAPIEIDWNKTRYIHDGKNRGGFVFEGIEPTQIKAKSIPNGVIFPNARFYKQIFPQVTIAMSERKDYSAGKDKLGLYGGKLPPGENSILLAILSHGELIGKKISVVITEQIK